MGGGAAGAGSGAGAASFLLALGGGRGLFVTISSTIPASSACCGLRQLAPRACTMSSVSQPATVRTAHGAAAAGASNAAGRDAMLLT
eukprot:COSAG06_NODE_842_length_11986_cov_54.409355_12_plen_87_part_00